MANSRLIGVVKEGGGRGNVNGVVKMEGKMRWHQIIKEEGGWIEYFF